MGLECWFCRDDVEAGLGLGHRDISGQQWSVRCQTFFVWTSHWIRGLAEVVEAAWWDPSVRVCGVWSLGRPPRPIKLAVRGRGGLRPPGPVRAQPGRWYPMLSGQRRFLHPDAGGRPIRMSANLPPVGSPGEGVTHHSLLPTSGTYLAISRPTDNNINNGENLDHRTHTYTSSLGGTETTTASNMATRPKAPHVPPSGVWCPAVTLFDPETDTLDIASQKKYFALLARSGLAGLLVLGTNAETFLLTREERKALLVAAREAW